MKKQNLAIALSLSAVFVMPGVRAVENYWTGAVNGFWDQGTMNWAVRGSGAACAWTRPSDTVIDTSLFAPSSPTTLTVKGASLYVTGFLANVEKGKSVMVDVNGNNGLWCAGGATASFRKTGEGELSLYSENTASDGKRGNGNPLIVFGKNTVSIEAGTLKVHAVNSNGGLAAAGSKDGGRTPADKMTEYDVHPGAKFIICSRAMTGNVNYGSGMRLRLRDGGTLQIGPDPKGEAVYSETVDELLLEGGTVTFQGLSSQNWGMLGAGSLLKLTGAKPCTLSDGGDATRSFILGYGGDAIGNLFQDHVYPVIDVADVTGDDGIDLNFDMTIGRQGAPGGNRVSFTKKGPGTLRFSAAGDAKVHGVNGHVNLLEGEVQFFGIDSFHQHGDNKVYVSTNATLTFATAAPCGQLKTLSNGRSTSAFHIDHGRFLLKPRIANYNNFGDMGYCYLGKELVLENARFDSYVEGYSKESENGLPALIAGSLVHAKAVPGESWTADMTPRDPSIRYQLMQVNAPGTEFRVDDTTGDEDVDMTLGFQLMDFCTYQGTHEASRLIKTGAGTLMVTNKMSNVDSVEVREGTLLVKNPSATDYNGRVTVLGSARSFLGNNQATNGVVLVTTNGTLKIDYTGQYCNGTYGDGSSHRVTRPLVVNGGLVDISGNAGNGGSCVQMFGPVTLENGGRFDYTGMKVELGPFGVHGALTVDGSEPVTLQKTSEGGANRMFLWPNYQTSFDVKDVTGDLEVDFTTYLCPGMPGNAQYFDGAAPARGKGQPDNTWRYGWTKTGPGTMELKTCDGCRFHTLPVIVSNGTLVVSADFYRSIQLTGADGAVQTHVCAGFEVCAGAHIGGEGMVSGVKLEDGAGFFATSGQTKPLESATAVALPKSGTVLFKVPQGQDPTQVARARIVRSAMGFTGVENLSNWKVVAPGYPDGSFRLAVRGDALCTVGGGGLSVIVR